MNPLFLTQGQSLRTFFHLGQALADSIEPKKIGLYVAHEPYFRSFAQRHPELSGSKYLILKEWELPVAEGPPPLERIRTYERRLGVPTLWRAVLADRRLFYGPMASMRQGYAPDLCHDQILEALAAALEAFDRLFEKLEPGLVMGFICVTLGDYLGYLFARAHGIPYLNLRPSRIDNYAHLAHDIFEPSSRVEQAYTDFRDERRSDDGWRARATEYLTRARAGPLRYEGVVTAEDERPRVGLAARARAFVPTLASLARPDAWLANDRHAVPAGRGALHSRLLAPLRMRRTERKLRTTYVSSSDLQSLEYAFFPLHTEPEVALLVYSRACLNQIETARQVALSLPAGMKLVVKEHPVAIRKRSLGYYRKLQEIPNLVLAPPEMAPWELVGQARVVTTIGGSIGFDGVLRDKPVVVLGRAPYEMLPDTMVRRVTDLERLGEEIQELLQQHQPDPAAVVDYVAAAMAESEQLNLYSVLLGRGDASGLAWESRTRQRFDEETRAFAAYVLRSLGQMRPPED